MTSHVTPSIINGKCSMYARPFSLRDPIASTRDIPLYLSDCVSTRVNSEIRVL